jgi:hypothetical protein
MEEVTVTELTKEGPVRVFKISQEEVLGILRVYGGHYIWSPDIFAKKKIGYKVAVNHYKNYISI